MSIRTTGVRYDLIARDSASKAFKSVGRSAAQLDGGMGRLARSVAYAGAALAGGFAAAAVVSAERAVRFEASMKRIQTQAGGSARDVAVLSKQVLQLGKTAQQGPQQLAEALYHLKSVGLDNAAAMKALKVSSDLAAVGGADLEATTNALAGAWRSGIRGAESFTKAAATVNSIIGAGNMTMDQFVEAIGTGILPAAKSFGLSLSQVGSALALMTDEGIPAVDAATRLRMSISLLGAPSAAAEKQLKLIHLTGLQLAKAMRSPEGLIGAVALLKQHLDDSGLSAARQSQILSRAFGGGRSSSGILTLVNNLGVLRAKQEQVNTSTGKYGPAVEAQRKTAAAQLHILESNLQVFSIQAGDKLLPPLTKFVTFLTETALPAAGHFTTSLAHLVPVDQIESGFSTATRDIEDFFRGLNPKKPPVLPVQPKLVLPKNLPPDALKYGLPVPTITPKIVPPKNLPSSAIRYGITLHTVTPPASAAQQEGARLRKLLSGGITDAIKGLDWGKLGSQLGSGLGKAFRWITTHGADLTRKFAKAMGGVDWTQVGKAVGGQALGFAVGFLDSMGRELFSPSWWKRHWWDAIIAALSIVGIGKIAGPLAKIFDRIPVLRSAAPLLRKVSRLTKPLGDAAGKVTKFFGSSLWKGIGKVFPEGTAVLEREAGLFTTRVGVWGLDLMKAGRRALRGLGDGIKTGFEWPLKKIGEGIAWLLKPFAKAGSWLVDRGGEMLSGLRTGIARGASKIGTWVSARVVAPVRGTFTGAGSWLTERGTAFVSGLKNGIVAGARKLGAWTTTHVVQPAKSAFSGAGSWLYDTGTSLLSGLKNGIVDSVKGIGKWLKKWLVDPVVDAVKHWFGIRSPSKVFRGIGSHLVAGLMQGLASSHGLDIAKTVFGDLPSALAAIVGKGLVHIEQLPGKALKALQGLGSKGLKLLGSAGQSLFPGTSSHMSDAMALGRQMMLARGFQPSEWGALRQLWTNESGWRWNATNPSSGAYGIPQALPGGKMASAGADWRTNPATQIAWGLDYIRQRYGTPSFALASWMSRSPHWYAKGGLAQVGETAWVGERGPELMQVTQRGTRIFSNRDSMAIAGAAGLRLPGYAGGTVAAGQVAAAQRAVDYYRNLERNAHSRAARRRDQLLLEAAEKKLAAAKKELTAATHVSNSLANGFLRTLETGSASAIASAIKAMNTQLQAAGAGSLVAGNLRTSARLQSLANQRASVQSRIAAARQYATDQSASLGDYLSITGTSATNVSDLIAQMRSGQRAAGGFASEVSSLAKRGLSKTLLAQLASAGPGSQLAAALAHASADDIRQLNAAAAAQSKLTTSFGQTMANAMYDSGKNAGKGFLSGLKGQEAALQAEMDKLAAGMVATIKKKLGIKSPSTVFRDQVGRQIALGTALGIRQHTPHVRSAAQRMADTAAAVSFRGGGGRAASGVASVRHETHVHVRFADPKLRDLIRVEVDEGLVELAAAAGAGAAL